MKHRIICAHCNRPKITYYKNRMYCDKFCRYAKMNMSKVSHFDWIWYWDVWHGRKELKNEVKFEKINERLHEQVYTFNKYELYAKH